MKPLLLMGFAATALCFAQISRADFSFISNDSNACNYVSGEWTGTGKASNWIIGECTYHGTGIIGPLDSAGRFTINVSSDKDSGTFLCPKHAEKQLSGICNNGTVTFITEYGELNGDFSETSGSAQGTLSDGPGLYVAVTLLFQRVGS